MKRATIEDAPAILNTNDKAMWVIGYNEGIDATIRHLAAGLSAEPFATLHHDDGYFTTKGRDTLDRTKMRTEVYTFDQLALERAAARLQENERCLKAVHYSLGNTHSGLLASKAIRALIGAPSW